MKHTTNQRKDNPRIGTYLEILKQDMFLFEVTQKCLKSLDKPEDQMYAILWAPTLVRYVAWVLAEAIKDGQERLYFLARDAYPMYVAAKDLAESMDIPIEIRYLRVSRYSLRIPEYHLLGENCLDRIFLSGIDVSFYQILKRAGLCQDEIYRISEELQCDKILRKNLNPREIADLKRYVKQCCKEHKTDMLEIIYANSKAAYDNTLGYLKQEGLLDSVRYAVVDSGWVGTIQKSIQTLVAQIQPKRQIDGYYFGLYELPEEHSGCNYKAYYFEPAGKIRRKAEFSNCLYEVMYSEPCPMVKGYIKSEEQYVPTFSETDNPNKENLKKNNQTLKLYMKTMIQIVEQEKNVEHKPCKGEAETKEYEKSAVKKRQGDTMVQQLYRTIMATPNAWEAEWYGRQLFSDDLADDHMRGIANELSQKEIHNLRISRKLLIMSGLLHQELHESGWIEGTIVNANKHIASNLRAAKRAKYLTYIRQSMKARKTKE